MTTQIRQAGYGLLAVSGLCLTMYFNLQFMNGSLLFDPVAFIQGGYANAATSSLTSDLTIAFLAFLWWLQAEAKRCGVGNWWLYLLLGFFVAFAFAFPLFLLVRERKLAQAGG